MTDRAGRSDGIDFARYLSIWLFDCHEPETLFWRTMNPARLFRLYDARFPNGVPNGVRSGHRNGYRGQMPAAQDGTRYMDLSPRPDNEDDGTLLAAYFLGGD